MRDAAKRQIIWDIKEGGEKRVSEQTEGRSPWAHGVLVRWLNI